MTVREKAIRHCRIEQATNHTPMKHFFITGEVIATENGRFNGTVGLQRKIKTEPIVMSLAAHNALTVIDSLQIAQHLGACCRKSFRFSVHDDTFQISAIIAT